MKYSDYDYDIEKYLFANSKSLKDYISLIRTNLKSFVFIILCITVGVLVYVLQIEDIYKSTVTLKITRQQQDILQSTRSTYINTEAEDRFIANEIEIIKSIDTREKVAKALIDSINNQSDRQTGSKETNLFMVLKPKENDETTGSNNLIRVIKLLKDIVTVEQVEGIDLVEITAESPSPYEAAMIANLYADQYLRLNLEVNRNQLNPVRLFLERQSKEKLAELNQMEDTLKRFQEKWGIVALDAQSTALINQLAQLDAQRDATQIDLVTSREILNQYKNEIKQQDPHLAVYLESRSAQTYIEALQKQIAELQMNKDLAMANKNSNIDISRKINEYDKRINELKGKLTTSINEIKTGAFTTSPEQIKDITKKLIDEGVNNASLNMKLGELQKSIQQYEQNFYTLPKKSIKLAQLERKRESLQQLYLLIDQKYQEALINELSQPGNAFITSKGRIPDEPFKPKRILFILIGLFTGFGVAFGYILIKEYFNNTVKTPEDIHNKSINILAWVPYIKNIRKNGSGEHELIVNEHPDSPSSEAFRVIRARIQFSRIHSATPKAILITSPAAGEGKTLVSVNLAGSFAQSHKKTLLVDCDLRRPRIHSIMGVEKTPGLVDYLLKRASFDQIVKKSEFNNLSYITSGTILTDPTEVFESKSMKYFIDESKIRYDIVIFDSAPIVAVIDSEILARLVDGTILVLSADRTELELMNDALELLMKDNIPFLGTVLNNFKYKNGYKYYHKYYYNYSSNGEKVKKHNVES